MDRQLSRVFLSLCERVFVRDRYFSEAFISMRRRVGWIRLSDIVATGGLDVESSFCARAFKFLLEFDWSHRVNGFSKTYCK